MITAYKAGRVFSGDGSMYHKGIAVLDSEGRIVYSGPDAEGFPEAEDFGETALLCPGFVNAHTHLELSWMRGRISPGLGLDGFIRQISDIWKQAPDDESKVASMEEAVQEMISGGIVAAGDIANGKLSLQIQQGGALQRHTFVEVFSSHEEMAELKFAEGMDLLNAFREKGSASLVPHAPYSVSPLLLEKILSLGIIENARLSIHHQENPDENEYYLHGRGPVARRLMDFGISAPTSFPPGKRPLEYILSGCRGLERILLVHNTYASVDDIRVAMNSGINITWVLCPNANLYIEGRLPDLEMLRNGGVEIALGTDSLASNRHLSILEEMRTLQSNYPDIPLDELILWATLHGARALGMDAELGSLSVGKKPGLLCIQGLDGDRIVAGTSLRRLV